MLIEFVQIIEKLIFTSNHQSDIRYGRRPFYFLFYSGKPNSYQVCHEVNSRYACQMRKLKIGTNQVNSV